MYDLVTVSWEMDIAGVSVCAFCVFLQMYILSAVEENCKIKSIHAREKSCNPALGAVTTDILASNGNNFTQVCR